MSERRIIDNVYLFWVLLSLPALWMIVSRYVLHGGHEFLALSGDWPAYLLVITMAITPLQMIVGPLPWLRKRRRYLGVATFGYSLLHLVIWLSENNVRAVIKSFFRPEILVGWIAFAIFVVLAWTSTDEAVRKYGPRWKAIQRWVYPAAVLTFLHWILTAEHTRDALYWAVPLMAVSAWRYLRFRSRMRPS